MPRPKALPDEDVLETALALMFEHGPEALTFAALSERCGLSGATLVQRFRSKDELKRHALSHGWDRLDKETARRAADIPRTPEGAIHLLVGLSTLYSDVETYASMLRLLREDLDDPVLRRRAANWKNELCSILDECFDDAPMAPEGIGMMVASQWQGAHLLWSFESARPVEVLVEESLRHLISLLKL